MQMKEMRTKIGYVLGEVVSALQKSIRRGDEEGALYWSLELSESSFGQYLWRRLLIIASEDIGLADPLALVVTLVEHQGDDQVVLEAPGHAQ